MVRDSGGRKGAAGPDRSRSRGVVGGSHLVRVRLALFRRVPLVEHHTAADSHRVRHRPQALAEEPEAAVRSCKTLTSCLKACQVRSWSLDAGVNRPERG